MQAQAGFGLLLSRAPTLMLPIACADSLHSCQLTGMFKEVLSVSLLNKKHHAGRGV